MANSGNLTPWKPGQSGNPKGKPKGAKHINTWVQELLEDEEFEATIREGLKIVNYKGAPIKAIIRAQTIKAMNGDTKAFDSLVKSGWAVRQEIDHTTNGKDLPTPIYGGKSGDSSS